MIDSIIINYPKMYYCPICSGKTLRHIRNSQIYWYCSHCHQEVPNLKIIPTANKNDILIGAGKI